MTDKYAENIKYSLKDLSNEILKEYYVADVVIERMKKEVKEFIHTKIFPAHNVVFFLLIKLYCIHMVCAL